MGRYVVFESSAANLTADGGNSFKQIFIRDTFTNKTRLITRADDGTLANGDSSNPSVSGSAHYVAFESTADNLSTEDVDTVSNVYLRDTTAAVTTLVSRAGGLERRTGRWGLVRPLGLEGRQPDRIRLERRQPLQRRPRPVHQRVRSTSRASSS